MIGKTASDTSVSDFSLVAETALDTGDTDLILTPEQFEALDQHVKRRFAAEANTDCINGKSTALELREFFVRQETLKAYEP